MISGLELGSEYIGVFTVYDSDGFTPKSGETVFSSRVHFEGAESLIPVVISEIGFTGDYQIRVIPDSLGSWSVRVFSSYDGLWRGDSFLVIPRKAVAQVNCSFDDSIPGMFMEVWLERDGYAVSEADVVSCEVSVYDIDGAELFTESSSSPKSGGYFSLFSATSFDSDRPYNLKVTVTDSMGSVVSYHGISTVG